MSKFKINDKIKHTKKADAPILVIDKITNIFGDEVYCVSALDKSIKLEFRDTILTTYRTDRDYEISQEIGW